MGCGASKNFAPKSSQGIWKSKVKRTSESAGDAPVNDVEYAVNSAMLFAKLAKLKEEDPCGHCLKVFGGGGGFPETWDDGMTFHCSRCKTVFPDPQRQTLEESTGRLYLPVSLNSAP
eukprot:1184382-Prorocentrum_minimum.AAC.1